ncbi:MAG: acetoin utilization protein AcuC [Actinomycetales bacterium]|nr:acetoin utilization protein AcuC [Actinomycetales bacterium]
MTPDRLELTTRLCRELGLLSHAGVHVTDADPVPDPVLATVHTEPYLEAVRAASVGGRSRAGRAAGAFGLGTDDVPVFRGMHEASARIVGGTLDVALAVWNGEAGHGINIAGGMHHAMPERASGFCVYNDLAIAVRALLRAGAQRVAYVDVDVHHGDGMERIFWDDPRVLTVSLHETGEALFPGSGHPGQLGGPGAEGTAVNVALPPGTGDAGWLRAFHAVVPPLVRAFQPQILISQHGCDTHELDPLGHLTLSVDAQRAVGIAVHELAHELCAGRWVGVGGGGYAVVEVVPRAWAHLVGIAAHHAVEPSAEVPEPWRRHVRELFGLRAPRFMTDGAPVSWREWSGGGDPSDAVDRAVAETRHAVFPRHGLDPLAG